MNFKDEPGLWVRCKCGNVYTLHMHTVCPICYRWPREGKRLDEERKDEEAEP